MSSNGQWAVDLKLEDDNSVKNELQKQVVTHNVKQFFLNNLQICRICLETEDDSKGTATLNPITIAIWNFLELQERDFPNMICTKCERTVVNFMVLMEMCGESNSFISSIKDEVETDLCQNISENEVKIEVLDDVPSENESTNAAEAMMVEESLAPEENLIETVDIYPENSYESFTSDVEDKKLFHDIETTKDTKFKGKTYIKLENGKFECLFCGKSFDTTRSHATHVRVSHKRPHKCPVEGCEKAFGLPTMVRRHIKQMHSHHEQVLNTDNKDNIDEIFIHRQNKRGKFECSYCGDLFTKRNALDCHVRQTHEYKEISCEVCGKIFNETRMKCHMKIHIKPYECNECGRRFVDKFLLKKHLLAIHLKINSYLCSHCGQKFNSAQRLRRHVAKVHEKRWSKNIGTLPEDQKGYCKHCGLRFLDKTELIQHVKEHTVTLKCGTCAKKFSSHISLEKHEKRHKDVDHPFQCQHCDSRYATKSLLYSHFNKKHIAQGWLCTFCHKKFTTPRALDNHERSHEGIKEYQCFLCEKEFAIPRRLREHLIANHTNSRFQCSECDGRFICQRGIEAHLRREHPGLLEIKKDISLFFQPDEPLHSQIMTQYREWLKKITEKRQRENKNRLNIGVEVIEVAPEDTTLIVVNPKEII